MKRLAEFVTVMLLAFSACRGEGSESESITIPLDQIWAVQMPGTRNLEKLAADQRSLSVSDIRGVLTAAPPKGQAAREGFAVQGTGFAALQQAHAILLDEKKLSRKLPNGSDISAVFFSYENNWYVHVQRVEQRGNVVDIHYRFVPHETMDTSEHVAIIPLGKLPAGDYDVNVIQTPMERSTVSDEVARRVGDRMVCRSFSFIVTEQGEKRTKGDGDAQ